MPRKILCVVGARPNFMKIAPIMRAFDLSESPLYARLLHTGQHYDEMMSDSFFKNFALPEPNYNLNVGSGTHAEQTAKVFFCRCGASTNKPFCDGTHRKVDFEG